MLKSLAKHLSGIALIWVVVLLGTMLLLRSYSQPSSQREVPALAGMSKAEATDVLRELGLEEVWQDSIYAATGKPGAVVEQHPPAGSSVKVGRKVLLTTYRITPPSERVAIQEGQDAKLAERILSTRGFKIEIKEEPHRLLAGKVIRVEHQGKEVGDEARFPKGTRLRLVVGVAGAQEVRVPWLVGLSLKDATTILARRNLAVGHVGYAEDVTNALDTTLAVVVSQDVSPADQLNVREGTAIDLYLGKH